MTINIQAYSLRFSKQYERLLEESPVAMFNHSLHYREFLKAILPDAMDHYLLAFQGSELVAVLPTFIMQGTYGAAVNSLPFYGSHGGIVYREHADVQVFKALISALHSLCEKVGAFTCTLIEPPWEGDQSKYDEFGANLFDERIGQITPLPVGVDPRTLTETLLGMYHQKTRNMVRKGMKSGFDISYDGSIETMTTLQAVHEENLLRIGGLPKSLHVFLTIAHVFNFDQEYRIYTARKDGQIVSLLLLFYYKDTVEYFCPATIEAYRSDQPLSLLIFTAMHDAVLERGARYWNWGGTWLSQTGVYNFKARWGTKDFRYRYHTRVQSDLDNGIYRFTKDELLKGYQFFYTMPFKDLI